MLPFLADARAPLNAVATPRTLADVSWPHWIPAHRGMKVAGFENERDLWAYMRPARMKIVTDALNIPYLEDVPAYTQIYVRHYRLTDPTVRVFRDVADAEAQADAMIDGYAQIVDDAEHHGRARENIWICHRNEPFVGPGGQEPPALVNAYTVHALRRAHALKMHSLIFEFGSGWGDNWDARLGVKDTQVDWDPYRPAIEEMDAFDKISQHPYWPVGGVLDGFEWYAGRPEQRPRWMAGKKFVFGECGHDGGVGGGPAGTGWLDYPGTVEERVARFLTEWTLFWSLLLADPDVEGGFMFTSDGNGYDWGHFQLLCDAFLKPWLAVFRQPLARPVWGDARTDRWQWVCEKIAQETGLDARVLGTMLAIQSGGWPQERSADGRAGLMAVSPRERGAGYEGRPLALQLGSPTMGMRWGGQILKGHRDALNGDLARAVYAYEYGRTTAQAADLSQEPASSWIGGFRRTWVDLWHSVCPVPGTDIVTPPPPPPPATDPLGPALAAEFGTQYRDLRATLARNPSLPWFVNRPLDDVDRMIIHHTTGDPAEVTWEAIAHWSAQPAPSGAGWCGIPYSIGVDPDGGVAYLCDIASLQGHTGYYATNRISIGVAVLGNYETAQPPAAMLASLKRLVVVLDKVLGRRLLVLSHKTVEPGTQCPGQYLILLVPGLAEVEPPPPPEPPPPTPGTRPAPPNPPGGMPEADAPTADKVCWWEEELTRYEEWLAQYRASYLKLVVAHAGHS